MVAAHAKTPPSVVVDGVAQPEGARPPAILYLMHGASLPDAAALFMHTLWGSLCAVCNLKCAHGRRPAARTGWDVLIDHEASVRPEASTSCRTPCAGQSDCTVERRLSMLWTRVQS